MYTMIKMDGGEVVRILCVSIIGGFIRKGLILILIVCLFSTNFRRIIVWYTFRITYRIPITIFAVFLTRFNRKNSLTLIEN